MKVNKIIQEDCLKAMKMKEMKTGSIDCIITDPPYQYLKHILDVPFDEKVFFKECFRVLKNNRCLVFFGRGESFYRWNTICNQIGFKFKEELIWFKKYSSSPFTPIGRVHETLVVLEKGKRVLNKVYIDYIDYRESLEEYKALINVFKRSINFIKKANTYEEFKELKEDSFKGERTIKHCITGNKGKSLSRKRSTVKSIIKGRKLSSILSIVREHYRFIHPTQKPVKLLKQLIQLTSEKHDIILDPFAGSGSLGVSCNSLKRKFILIERNKDFFKSMKERLIENKIVFEES